jgi:hypothetical protein
MPQIWTASALIGMELTSAQIGGSMRGYHQQVSYSLLSAAASASGARRYRRRPAATHLIAAEEYVLKRTISG